MADLFEDSGIKVGGADLFQQMGVSQPTIQERNASALSATPVENIPSDIMDGLNQELNYYAGLAKKYASEEEIQAWKDKGPIGFIEAQDFATYQDHIPLGGFFKAADLALVYSAGQKLKGGEELSVNEGEAIRNYLRKQTEMSVRGMSVGGGISYYGSQVPAFMVEFVATGGVGKTAQVATEKALGKVIKNTVAKKAVGVAANIATRTTVLPSMYLPKYGEQRINDFMAITDKGSLLFQESKESPATSALKAYGYTMAEVASEMSGAAIGKYVIDPALGAAAKTLKVPMTAAANKLPSNIKLGLYEAYKKLNPNASLSKIMTAAGWNGMLAEMGEERVSDVLRATLDLSVDDDYTFEDYLDAITPTKDQLLIEAGIISIMGGVKTSADITMNILQKKYSVEQAKEIVDNMTATEQEAFVEKNLTLANVDPNAPVPIDNQESFAETLYREVTDRLSPIEKLEKRAGKNLDSAKKPYLRARLFSNIAEVIKSNISFQTSYIDESGNVVVTGRGLKPILDDFSNSVAHIEPNAKVRQKDFGDYMVALRVLQDIETREDLVTSEKDMSRAVETMAMINNKYGEDLKMFETFAKEVHEFQFRILENLVRSGVMSQELFDEVKNKNKNYVPMQRVLDEEVNASEAIETVSTRGMFDNANKNAVLKKFIGSNKEVKNVYESIFKNTAKIIDISQRNSVALAVANLADIAPDQVKKVKPLMDVIVEGGQKIYRPSKTPPRNTITVFRNGKKEYYEVSKPLLTAMQQLDPAVTSLTIKILTAIPKASASLVRAGATLVPEFWLRNAARDYWTANMQSQKKVGPVDMVRALTSVIGKDSLYQEWIQSYGKSGTYLDLSDKSLQTAMTEIMNPKSRVVKYIKNPLRVLQGISNALEEAPRLAVYKAARASGLPGIEAALMSRDSTVDFSRGGVTAKKANEYIPFLNVGVQSVDRLIKTIKNHPVETLFWGTATITVPSLLLSGYYLYGAPDDERREYLEIPQWQKDIFWIAKIDGEWKRFPKPFSYGYLFGSVPERFMTWGYQGDKPEMRKFWQELATGITGTLSPVYDASSVLPPILKVSIESIVNYNFFTGNKIYPDWMEDLSPEERATVKTTETAKLIGEKLGVSPAKVDNALRGQLASASAYLTDAGDSIINKVKEWNGEDISEKPVTPSDIAVIKAFSVREPVGYGSNSVTNFFDSWTKLSQHKADFNFKEGEDKSNYMEKYERELGMYAAIEPYYEQISDLGKESVRIYSDVDMDSQEKVDALSDLGQQMVDIAAEANNVLKDLKDE